MAGGEAGRVGGWVRGIARFLSPGQADLMAPPPADTRTPALAPSPPPPRPPPPPHTTRCSPSVLCQAVRLPACQPARLPVRTHTQPASTTAATSSGTAATRHPGPVGACTYDALCPPASQPASPPATPHSQCTQPGGSPAASPPLPHPAPAPPPRCAARRGRRAQRTAAAGGEGEGRGRGERGGREWRGTRQAGGGGGKVLCSVCRRQLQLNASKTGGEQGRTNEGPAEAEAWLAGRACQAAGAGVRAAAGPRGTHHRQPASQLSLPAQPARSACQPHLCAVLAARDGRALAHPRRIDKLELAAVCEYQVCVGCRAGGRQGGRQAWEQGRWIQVQVKRWGRSLQNRGLNFPV